MKISPLPAGTSVTPTIGQTYPTKIERAKAIAAGEPPPSSGDTQVDRTQAKMKSIRMKTQVSTNRHEIEALPQEEINAIGKDVLTNPIEIPTLDVSEPAPVVEETKPLSPQFVALAKKQRALQVKERELVQREEALKTQSPEGNAEYLSKAELQANPLKVFEAGVTYDQLTEAILNNQNGVNPEIQQLRNDIKSLKEELNGQFSTRDQEQEQQVIAEIKREANNLITQDESFEAIREAKARNHPDFSNGKDPVSTLIHRTWKKTGEIMDVTEAAKLVEDQLIDEALPFAKIKKVQSRLQPPEPVVQTPTAPKPGTKVMRTLTNRDNASPVMDRRARAIAAMNGTLKRG